MFCDFGWVFVGFGFLGWVVVSFVGFLVCLCFVLYGCSGVCFVVWGLFFGVVGCVWCCLVLLVGCGCCVGGVLLCSVVCVLSCYCFFVWGLVWGGLVGWSWLAWVFCSEFFIFCGWSFFLGCWFVVFGLRFVLVYGLCRAGLGWLCLRVLFRRCCLVGVCGFCVAVVLGVVFVF